MPRCYYGCPNRCSRAPARSGAGAAGRRAEAGRLPLHTWAKPVVVIAVIVTFAVVAAADILARGYAAGRRGELVPMPDGLQGTIEAPGANPKVAIVAARFSASADGKAEYLIVKEDKSSAWIASDKLNV